MTDQTGKQTGKQTGNLAQDEGAPLVRPALHTVLLELEREVTAPPADVFEFLAAELAPTDGHTKYAVYADARTAVLQGDWWYRGEYRVTEAANGGATVSYTVVNVAQVQHEGGNAISKGTLASAPDAFARRLDAIEAALVGDRKGDEAG
ncbi:hypothetical protein [Streptomyces sp. GS7]|uniref:hypothetical protein n=1 Tax=Streptomyces sp. GS7 TaxID=2692234 RepID=UPI00131651B2|nr:hypothetical protein [Streptomyces sp. GS7]QHC21201.1 hypothetical protein GR130_06905 [Streptomyces sp. GS7]